MQFNLLDEPWIPCLNNDGKLRRVGVREALTQAGTIRQIAASNPMDRLAILRFLLALLYWCKGNPPAGMDVSSGGSFPAEWFAKLDEHEDYFNLLGEGKRFYQDHGAQRPRAITDLIQEIPTGNNFWHFRHSTDNKDGLCLACCAMGLLRLPLFSVSGLPDLRSGINGAPPIYVIPLGKSLFETLLLNWAPCASLGVPAWGKPDLQPLTGQAVPLLTGLTLLSRRVWLHDPDGPPDSCTACGSPGTALLKTCEFQTAGKQENEQWHDPHVVYTDKTPSKTLKTPDLTAAGKFRMDRPWPDLFARMVETGKFGSGDKPVTLLVVGFATDQAKNIDVWERTVSARTTKSTQPEPASFIVQWQKEGTGMARRVAPPNGKGSPHKRNHPEIASAIVAIRPHVEGKVSAKAGELLSGGDAAWQEAASEYGPMMELIARSLSPGFTTAAVQRRRHISHALPDMRPTPAETATGKKTARKKGGAG
ncbi:MAG: type I-E CRISPR-associated protein Cse1/CasA [Chloroflexi bacterium]|nr:type I-E CRISPR-associated protein Cse1/CasA [Chloroflexota bacterium]